MVTIEEIAGMIDHSLLKPILTDKDIREGCRIADKYQVASVCVRPSDVILASEVLKKSAVLVTTVIGFPHGTTTTRAKLEEAKEAIINGAAELDVVINIGKMKSGDYGFVSNDLKPIVEHAHAHDVKIKVIFENCFLTDAEIIAACDICNELDVDWVKTSTGYGTSGAEARHIKLMREHSKPGIQVKAAGGIRTLEQAIEMRTLGCTRFGATATVEILEALKKQNS
jgi:deoxyribose-phosphate aldolase